MIPPFVDAYKIPSFFTVENDTTDEIRQSFALLAEIGSDVPDDFVCFQTPTGVSDCLGRLGATEIIIIDNDGRVFILGFSFCLTVL